MQSLTGSSYGYYLLLTYDAWTAHEIGFVVDSKRKSVCRRLEKHFFFHGSSHLLPQDPVNQWLIFHC